VLPIKRGGLTGGLARDRTAQGENTASSPGELEEWERTWISKKLTQFRRTITGTIGPHLALFLKSTWASPP
jgi:hypothetical protein